MSSKFVRGMNLQEQKKCGILVTVIGLVMFAIGFLLGDAHMGDFYSGLGCGLFVCSAEAPKRTKKDKSSSNRKAGAPWQASDWKKAW